MKRIIWLASYPKSGSTWLRVFLANYRCAGAQPININALGSAGAVDQAALDALSGVELSDLSQDEIENYRPLAYRLMAEAASETLLLKIHDAYRLTGGGEPLIPAGVTRGAIVIVRNPLDVAVSFAHHRRQSIEATIKFMAQDKATLAGSEGRLHTQVLQKLNTWGRHVLSWIEQKEFPVHLMRYEAMMACPLETFAGAVRFIGWEEDPARVARAVQMSAFENLQVQEREHGFREKPPGMSAFFRQGQVDSWREGLNPAQVARLVRDHGTVMRRLGYLGENGEILG